VRMANGTTVLSPGTVNVHLAIQNYSNTLTLRVFAYISRKLSGAELNYSPSDIEMLAAISALKELRCSLEGCWDSFTLLADHQPNVYLDTANNAHTVHRQARWLSVSCGYNYKWCYCPGQINVTDPISRAPQHFQHLCSMV
jgi:hypothetical protein